MRYREYPEGASKKFQVKQGGITSDQQEFILDNPEDHSPVGATAANYPSEHMSLPPCTLGKIGEKKDLVNLDHEEEYFGPEILMLERAIIAEKEKSPTVVETDRIIEEEESENYISLELEINHESALDPVEEAQYSNIRSVETAAPTERSEPPEETRTETGVEFNSTINSGKDGWITKVMFGPIICDLPAICKVVGMAGHSSNSHLCSCCCVTKEKIYVVNLDSIRPKNAGVLRKKAIEWKNAGTLSERKAIFKSFSVHYSVLYELPYFDPLSSAVGEPMHNIFLSLLHHHGRDIFGLKMPTQKPGVELLKSADGAAFLTNTEDGELH
ncbi:hypothetical protein PSHT_14459 [Puccinia striiformis]|uniref:Uncharacterized protein n=1 Tax=Puccinia striiformis TaxID=27350 RepID=A0A2S4UK45_9BASI|nr:hypothetical protein PSHT_14459 [Puccinia striiformis]